MNKTNNNGLKKAEAKVETILEQATRLPLAIRRSIVLGVLALVLLLIALVIAGIASCSGNSSREALVQETPASLNDGEAGAAPVANSTAAAESVSGYVQPQTVAGEDGVTTLEDEEDPSRQQKGDEAVLEDTPLPTEETPASTDAPTPEPTSQYTTLKKHDKSEEVTQLQNRLMELGYLEIDEPTDYFGSSTAYAVQLFQRQHNLTQDGVAGPTTQTMLYSKEAEKYCLKEGAEGRDVKQLQQQLCELGYLDEKEIDHVYGPTTISAIKTFQKRNKLTDDGMAGEKTLEKLYSDDARISSSLQKAQASASAAAAKAAKDKKTTPTPKPDTKADKVIKAAKSKLGCEYVLGDKGPDTFDCSGFIYWCLRQAGVYCTRLNAAGFSNKSSWKKISSISELEKGDLLFFKSDESSRVNHCGIYVGSGDMIDASSGNGKVIRRALSSYWKRNFVCARRPW